MAKEEKASGASSWLYNFTQEFPEPGDFLVLGKKLWVWDMACVIDEKLVNSSWLKFYSLHSTNLCTEAPSPGNCQFG